MTAPRAYPPRWAEAILRQALAPRVRDSITGDLLEEYREEILPARGGFRAALWYIWQTATLIALARRIDMNKRTSPLWLLAGIAWTGAIVALLLRSRFQPPVLPVAALVVPFAVVLTALTSLRSRENVRLLWRCGRVWAAALVVAAGVRMAADIIWPFDAERYLLAQVKPGFSELDFPSRFVFGLAVALILVAAGFHGTWNSGQVRAGIAVALSSAVAVTLPLFGMEVIGGEGWPAVQILLAASGIGSVLGAAGALLAQGLRGLRARALAVAALTCFGLAACSRAGAISSATQQAIDALQFDSSRPISVTGVITTIYLPPQGNGLILVKASDRGYIFRLGSVRAMAKAGTTRFSTHPGEKVLITGLLPRDARPIDGVAVAQASNIKTLDGRTIFHQAALR